MMKRRLKFLIVLSVISIVVVTTSSCDKNTEASTKIELNDPAEDARIEMANVTEVVFSWKKIPGVSEYTLRFASSANQIANTNIRVDAGDTDHYTMSSGRLHALFSDGLHIWSGEAFDVYWSVWPKRRDDNVKTQVHKMHIISLHHLLSLDGIHFETDASEPRRILVNLDGEWTVKSMEKGHWLHVSPLLGTGHGTVDITPIPNPGPARTTRVTISNHNENEDITLTVMQDAEGPIKLMSKLFIKAPDSREYLLSESYEYDIYNRLTKIYDYDPLSGSITRTRSINYTPMQITEVNKNNKSFVQRVYLDGDNLLVANNSDTVWYLQNMNTANLPESITYKWGFKRYGMYIFEYDEVGNIKEKMNITNVGVKWTVEQIRNGEVNVRMEKARYVHDDLKAPFYSCTSPKWLLRLLSNNGEGVNIFNNVVSVTYDDENIPIPYTHVYDNDGYALTNTQHEEKYEYISK